MSDRYADECERRRAWEGDTGQGEVNLLVPETLLHEIEEMLTEPDRVEPKLYTGYYL